MISRLAPALASIGIGCGILFSAALARDVRPGISESSPAEPAPARFASRSSGLPEGELVARLAIGRLEVDSPVFEGVGAATLARGPGHVPQTALPGHENGSVPSVIAIPRGRLGEAIGRLRIGDAVRLTTPTGPVGYRVVERRLHDPAAFRLDSVPEAHVTLLTPFPPDSTGPAPSRLAVILKVTS